MKKIFLAVLLISICSPIIAENPLELTIPQGESNFTVTEYFQSIYVSELIAENPQIKSITTKQFGQSFGYLNTLGGIGTNFLIEPEKIYEVYSNETITINLRS